MENGNLYNFFCVRLLSSHFVLRKVQRQIFCIKIVLKSQFHKQNGLVLVLRILALQTTVVVMFFSVSEYLYSCTNLRA